VLKLRVPFFVFDYFILPSLPAVSTTTDVSDCEGNFTQTLSFSSTSNETQCVTVNIRGDNIVEDAESFVVIFSSSDERDRIVYDNTTVTIIDDDGNDSRTAA
jgi:outer membrane lipoprotein-sorting protein